MRLIPQLLPRHSRRPRWLVVLALLAIVGTSARAQFTYSEDFKNSTAAGWVINPAGNSTPNVTLTSGAAPRTGDPEFGKSTIDPSGAGWLRLTNNTTNLANAVYFDTPVPSAGNSVNIQFGVNFFGGNNYAGTGADGITFFLYDASKPFQVGAFGGSIGYAQRTDTPTNGLNGGYIGVALDPYGNFSVADEGRLGGTASLQRNSVAVRGPGNLLTGYNYLAGTGNRDYTDTGSPTVQDAGDGTVPSLPYTMAYPSATARPNQSTQYRNVSVTINENSQLLVGMQFGEDGLWYNLLNVDLSSFVRPEQLKMGFSAGTGSGTLVTEIGGLLTINATAGSGNFIWDNGQGILDQVWGTSASNPLNWAGNTNPTLKSNVIFNSTNISLAQNIDVTGSDKVITNMYFSGTNSYTLGTTEARKLIFDSSTVGGLTSLNLTNDVGGSSAHSINLDVQMNRNLDINNNISPEFAITGNIDSGGNTLGLKGAGTTVLAGAISGTGALAKFDGGTTILRGSSPNTYTGTTTINAGTLQIEKATALGSTAAGTTVNSGGTLALAGSGTTFAAEGLTLNGTGVGGGGALLNSAGTNTWTGTVALGSAGANAIGVSGGSLNVSGVISGAAGNNLSKVGNGTLTLSGSNTYSGSTTVTGGAVAISADSGLGTAPSLSPGHLTLDGGTLQTTSTFTLNANRGVALGAAGGTFDTTSGTTLTYNGIAAGTGSLAKTGTGTLSLGGANTFTGATNINAGTLRLTADNTLANSTAVTIAGGATFDVNNRTDTVGSLAGAGNVSLGSGSLTIGANNTSTTFSGIASGTGNILKTGTGTTTFSGVNTFAGNLRINQGTVALGADNVFASSLVLNGGAFSTNGYSDSFNSLSLLATSSINFNSMSGTLGLGTGSRTAGALTIDNWAGSPTGGGASQLLVNSLTALDATFLSNVTFAGYGVGAQIVNVGGLFEIVPITGAAYTWGIGSGGTWTGNNWNGGVTNPGGINTTTVFGSNLTADSTVTLNANTTAGHLVFNDNNNYTVAPSGSERITMDVTGGSATLSASNTGAPTIAAGLSLNDNLVINQNSTGTLTLSATNAITGTTQNVTVGGSGNTTISGTITTGTGNLTMNGTGVLTLGADNTYTGRTIINSGTIAISDANQLGDNPVGATADQITLNGGTLRSFGTAVNFAADNRDVYLGTSGGTFETVTNLTIDNVISGPGSLTKSGAATLFLTDPNTYTGATNINAGTLAFGGGNDRLADTSAVTIASGATLDLVQYSDTVGSLAGAGTVAASGTGALTLTFGGLNTNSTFSGNITDGASATLSLVKNGSGTTILSGAGANTFDGTVTINGGALNIQKNSALGSATGGTTVASGGALEVQGGITVTGEALTLSGDGVATNGALRNISGNNTLTGAILLGGATTIKSETGTLTLSSGGITGTQNLIVAGSGNTTISGEVATGSGTVTKTGTGTLILSGANSYTGATTVNAGTLEIQNTAGLGTILAGTTVVSGATLALGGGAYGTAEGLSLAGTGVGDGGALRNVGADHTLTGNIVLTAETYIGVAGSTVLTAAGVVSGNGFGMTKLDTGTLVLSAANTYTGTTAVNAGTLQVTGAGALGTTATPTTISSGATVAFNNLSASSLENITVAGAGVGNAGAIQSTAGANTLAGNLTMTGDTTIGVSAGTLVSSGNLTGNYSLIKTGAGNLTLSGAANAYTGTTTLRDGTLTVTTNAPVSANGALGNSGSSVQIGDNVTTGTANLALLIGDAAGGRSVDRAISVNNFNPSGTTTLGGVNTSGTNTFAGNIGLGRDTTLAAAPGGTVAFNGVISGTGPVTAGSVGNTGTLVLGNANTYTGATTVAFGTLVAANNNALGTTAATTTVNSGATLGIQGGITVPVGESLSLSGGGVASVGALNNVSGDNIVAGNITLAASTSLGSTAGTGTLTGVISGNSLTKVGAGDLVLAGTSANTYSGGTTVSAGTLTLAKTAGINATGSSGNITVSSGGTLTLGSDNQIADTGVTLTLAGGTFRTNNNSDLLATLSLSASSNLSFSNGDSSILTFTNANNTATGTNVLTIDDWNGIPTVGGGGSQLKFANAGTNFGAGDIAFAGFGAGWTRLASGEIVPIATSGTTYTWTADGTGANLRWDRNANWSSSPDGFPGDGGTGQNDTAIFGNSTITTNRTLTLNGADRTLGYLAFNGTNSFQYTIGASNSLVFDVSNGNAQIQVDDSAAPTIAAGIILNANLNISSSSTGTLTIDGGITGNGGTRNLSVNGSGTVDLNGVVGTNIGTLTKAGSSTLILGAANTYTGVTTVNNGTLQLDASAPSGAAGALGTASSNVALGSAASPVNAAISLLSNGAGVGGIAVGRNIDVNNFGVSTTLGGINTGGTNTFSGDIALNKSVNLTAAAGGTVDFSGILGGTGGITKIGAGTVSLSGTGSNTFTGNVDIQAGTLQLAKSGGGVDAIGATKGAIGDLAAVTLSGATSILSINGPAAQILEEIGSLSGVAGSNVNVAQATAFTLYTGANNGTTTFAGTLTDTGANLSLVKQGTGIMTLTGANTHDGTTTVAAGTLVAANNTALGTATESTTVNAGATLGLQGGITVTGEALSVAAAASPNTASVANLSENNIWTGTVSMTGTTANDQVKFDASGGSQLTISGIISEANNAKVFAKTGTGTIILAGANTYTGSTNVTAGTLVVANNSALGAATVGTSVQIGASLGVQGGVTVASETFTLYGTVAPPAAPSIKNIADTNILAGAITLSGGINTGVAIDANTGSLTLNGAITQATNPNYVIKTGSADLILGGNASNTFSGGLTINDGKVIAAKTSGEATGAGNVNVGDGIGSTASAILQLNGNNQINSSSNVTIQTDGSLNLQGNTNSIGALTMGGGSVQGAGTLTLGGNLTFNGVGSSTANISSNLALGPTSTRVFQVGNNVNHADTDLTISGGISGNSSLNKTDLGTLNLTGSTANTFSGTFQVSDGTVTLSKTGAGLDSATGTGSISVGNDVGSANTAVLTLLAGNQINNSSSVTVYSDGKFDVAGFTDTIGSLAGSGAIQLGAGTLTTGINNNTTVVSGVISGSSGNLVKQGTGTMTLSASNTYSGTTTVSAGTLAITTSSALGTGDGTAGTGTTVGNNATLQVSGAVNVVNEALTLNGTGTSNNGALQNVSGSNTFGGPITLGSPAMVAVNSGTLTLGGTLTNAGNTLTVTGTGNTVTNGAITGNGGLAKSGVGALILNNTGNTYSGATSVTGGTIQIGANGAGPTNSALTLGIGTTLDVNSKTATVASLAGSAGSSVILGTGNLATGANNSDTSFAGVISGAGGSFTKNGTGTLTISGANSYTGATNINAGTLAAGANTVLSNQSAVTVASGAAFTLNNTTQAVGSIAGAGTVSIGSGQLVAGANNNSTTFSGVMSGSGGTFTKDGLGILTLTGVNTFTGSTTVAAGTLALGASNALSSSTSLTISSGATLAASSGVIDTIAGLTTTATSNIDLGSNSVLTVDRATASTLLGSLSGTGTLAYTGGGNLTLANTLNFATGTLAFGGTTIGSTPTSTLYFGSNTTIGTLRITGDTILDFGNSTASVLNATNFIITPGVKISITNWVNLQDYFYASNFFSGLIPAQFDTRGSAPENQITFTGFSNNDTAWQSLDRQITPAPEPATYGAMMMGGSLALLGYRRWKKTKPSAA